jgi:flagellar biosynthesis protein FlhB
VADDRDRESKSEEATEKRVHDSLEKGDVPLSRELSLFASVAAILAATVFLLREMAPKFVFALGRLLDNPGGWSLENGPDAVALLGAVYREAVTFILPPIIVFALFGLGASFLQNAPNPVLHRIQPDFSRISIRNGWRRIFGLPGLIEFLKAFFKFVAVSGGGVTLLRSEQEHIVNAVFDDPNVLPELVVAILVRLLATVAATILVLAAADLVWARVHWRRQLRMSRQEIKDELKQMEGDPLVKMRLRSLALDRSRKRMIASVPRATLVIANPTHYAVALRYVREEGGAPLVLAKGKDLIALKIREIAEAHDIPVMEDKALARSMYDSVEVDKMIPVEFYRAVAEVIHVLNTRRAGRAAAR